MISGTAHSTTKKTPDGDVRLFIWNWRRAYHVLDTFFGRLALLYTGG